MNIDFVLPFFVSARRHGSYQHFYHMAKGLSDAGHDVVVRCSDASGFEMRLGRACWTRTEPLGPGECEGLRVHRYPVRGRWGLNTAADTMRRGCRILGDAFKIQEVPYPEHPARLAGLDAEASLGYARDLLRAVQAGEDGGGAYSSSALGPDLPMREVIRDVAARDAVVIAGYFPFLTSATAVEEAVRAGVRSYLVPLMHAMDRTHHNVLLHRAVQICDGVMTLSPFGRDFALGDLGAKKAWFIGSAPPPLSSGAEIVADGSRRDAFVFFGRHEPSKNLDEAVRICEAASRLHGRRFCLNVIGAQSPDLENRLPPGSRIHSDLSQDGVYQVLREARALLFPSVHESFGIVVIEAYRAGTPALVRAGNLATCSILEHLGCEDAIYSDVDDAAARALSLSLPHADALRGMAWDAVTERVSAALEV